MNKTDIDSKDPEVSVGVDDVADDDGDSYAELRGWRKVRLDRPTDRR